MKKIQKRNLLILIIWSSLLIIGLSCSDDDNIIIDNNNPPAKPEIYPPTGAPPHTSTNQSITPKLTWICSDVDNDKITYDVYFGKSNTPPKVSETQPLTSYSTGTLEYGKKYYWKIVATDSHGASSTSDLWYFTTKSEDINPKLSLSPTYLDFDSTKTSLTFNITNSGNGTLSWNISDNKDWISVSSSSGTTTTESDQIIVTVNRTGLAEGTYTGIITVTSTNNETKYVSVSMTIPHTITPPNLVVSETSLDFGISSTSETFTISNSGEEILTWDISDNKDWMSVSPTSGNTTSETDQITVTINRSGLSTGTYSGIVTVNSNDGSKSIDVSMEVPPDPCNIVVTSPTSSTNLTIGSSYRVRWISGSGSVRIELWKDGGKRCTIVSSTSNDGSFSWAVDDCNGGTSANYQVKIIDVNNSSCNAFSDMFTIAVIETTICNAVADAFVSAGEPSTNNGSLESFMVGWFNSNEVQGYVKFDLSSIPQNAVIESAYLLLYCMTPQGLSYMKANLVRNSWSEYSITYNNKPSIYSQPQHSWSVPSQCGLVHEYNLVNIVKEWLENGYPNYGIRLSPNVSGSMNWILYYSKEDSGPSYRKPRLEVTYTSPPK